MSFFKKLFSSKKKEEDPNAKKEDPNAKKDDPNAKKEDPNAKKDPKQVSLISNAIKQAESKNASGKDTPQQPADNSNNSTIKNKGFMNIKSR